MKNKPFHVYGVKVQVGTFGVKVFSQNENARARVMHYLVDEGFISVTENGRLIIH